MASIQFIKPWLCAVLLTLLGCSTIKHTSTVETKQTTQTQKTAEQPDTNDDPFERDSPSAACFENEQAIKEAWVRLKSARDSFFASFFLPSFSFYTLRNSETEEQKTVFAEKHNLPMVFNKKEWLILKESSVELKTIAACVLMLEIQKF